MPLGKDKWRPTMSLEDWRKHQYEYLQWCPSCGFWTNESRGAYCPTEWAKPIPIWSPKPRSTGCSTATTFRRGTANDKTVATGIRPDGGGGFRPGACLVTRKFVTSKPRNVKRPHKTRPLQFSMGETFLFHSWQLLPSCRRMSLTRSCGFPLLHREDKNPFQRVAASEVHF